MSKWHLLCLSTSSTSLDHCSKDKCVLILMVTVFTSVEFPEEGISLPGVLRTNPGASPSLVLSLTPPMTLLCFLQVQSINKIGQPSFLV